jgi:purine-binding chemotaxis protein CheW
VRAVICIHSGERYALPLSAVRRVTEVSTIARVPRSPPALLGIMNQQGRVACVGDRGALVGMRPRPARPEGRVVMLQRARGDVGLYVSEVAGIESVPAELTPLPSSVDAACATVDLPEGPVKLIDPELLTRAIEHLVEA